MANWILVAHAAGARLYSQKAGKLTLLDTIEHPAGRSPGEAYSDRPGRAAIGGGGRTTFDAHTDPKEADTNRFAEMLADRLEAPAGREEFRGLVVVAPHKLLGALKGAMTKNVERRVTEWIAKDWVNLDDREVAAALAERGMENAGTFA